MSRPHPHRIHWFEIPVTNIDPAAALDAAALGVERERENFLISDPTRAPNLGTGTVVYLHASDGVAACLARAGARTQALAVQPTTSIGPSGTSALLEDLDGTAVGLHAPA